MWNNLTRQLLCHEQALVLALDEGAIACTRSLGIRYPFPAAHDPYWSTEPGSVVAAVAREHCLDVACLHASPDTSARVIFGAEWVERAKAIVAARTLHADTPTELRQQLVAQYAREHGVDEEAAALQLSAATKVWRESSGPLAAYVTTSAEGVHIAITGDKDDVTCPDEPSCRSVQETLDSNEQLDFHVLHTPCYERVAAAEALPGVDLTLCSACHVGGGTDYDGNRGPVLVCEDCRHCAHASCACPCEHATAREPTARVVSCTGLVPLKGAWYLRMSKWGRPGEHVGMLHPVALPALVAQADTRMATGRWKRIPAVRRSVSTMCGAASEFSAHLAMYGHVLQTGLLPLVYSEPAVPLLEGDFSAAPDMATHAPQDLYPAPGSMGQVVPAKACACLLSGSVASTLQALHVFHEPSFTHMCARFQAAGELDGILQRWLDLRLPLLPGATGVGGNAARMHAHAHTAVISLKSRQRMWVKTRLPEHWIVSEVDPVLPCSRDDDAACMGRLGLTAAQVPVPPPRARKADVAHGGRQRATHSSFAVRVLMNPSRHYGVLQRVLADAGATHAREQLLAHEIAPIGQTLSRADAEAFRAACLRSSLYGRLFLWMATHSYSTGAADDASGLLARPGRVSTPWKAGWEPVRMLRQCADASYVELACGAMKHWHQVISSSPCYLFETSLDDLQLLARLQLPDTVHVVPCEWTGLEVSDIVGTDASAVVVSRCGAPPPPGAGSEVHYMRGSVDAMPPACVEATGFMRRYPNSKWRLCTNCPEAERAAAHAHAMYDAM